MKKFLISFLVLVLFASCDILVDMKKVPTISDIPKIESDDVIEYGVPATDEDKKDLAMSVFRATGYAVAQPLIDAIKETFTPSAESRGSVNISAGVNILVENEVLKKGEDTLLNIETLSFKTEVLAGLDNVDLEKLTFKMGASVKLNLQADMTFSHLAPYDGSKSLLDSDLPNLFDEKTTVHGGFVKGLLNLEFTVLEGELNAVDITNTFLDPEVFKSMADEAQLQAYLEKTFGVKVKISLSCDLNMGAAIVFTEKDPQNSNLEIKKGLRYTFSIKTAELKNKEFNVAAILPIIFETFNLGPKFKDPSGGKITVETVNNFLMKHIFDSPRIGDDDAFLKVDFKSSNCKDETITLEKKYLNLEFLDLL